MLTTASKRPTTGDVFRKPITAHSKPINNTSKAPSNQQRMDEGINMDDLRRSMAEAGLGDVSIGENTFSSVVKALDNQQHASGLQEDTMSVDTTVLLNDYNPPQFPHQSHKADHHDHEYLPDLQGDPLLERQRLQEYCRRQLEALTSIRKQVLREEQATLDMTELNKFQFWNRMLQKERQVHAEEVAELRLQIRELQSCLDEIMDVIYLIPKEPSESVQKVSAALEEYPQIRKHLKK